MTHQVNKFVCIVAAVFFVAFAFAAPAEAQRRDFMTEPEIELVRDAQDIDARVDVLIKMADRRFAVLNIAVGVRRPSGKQSDAWGEEPKGTRAELLTDIKRLLQKAVDDIDDVAEHDANALDQNKTSGKLFPKAVKALAAAATRYTPVMTSLVNTATDETERGELLGALELCDQIIAAAAKMPDDRKN